MFHSAALLLGCVTARQLVVRIAGYLQQSPGYPDTDEQQSGIRMVDKVTYSQDALARFAREAYFTCETAGAGGRVRAGTNRAAQ
jgi:hypothetical protein